MNSKQVVFIGLVITSLLSSLVMFELIPGLPMALIVLVAGLMLTYYIALSQKRLDRLAEMNLLLRSNRAIQSKFQEADICGNLKFWAGCLVKSEHIFVWTEGDELNEEIIKAWPEWAALNACIRENQTTIVFNRKDNAPSLRPTPEWIKSYIGIPLKVEGNVVAILYEVNEQEKGFFDDKEREFLEEVSQQAALAWQKTFTTAELQSFYLFIIKSIIRALESQNPVFLNHGERVAAICNLLGSKLGLDEQEMQALQISALLHDAGRFLSDPMEDENSDKSASAPEKDTVSTDDHPRRGAEIFPTAGIYGQIREGIMYHHERYDGSGYPEGLERTEIPLIARIIAVADLYDAMTRLCPEEDRVDHYTAMRDMKRAMGSLLDPLVVVVMEEIEAELQEVIK